MARLPSPGRGHSFVSNDSGNSPATIAVDESWSWFIDAQLLTLRGVADGRDREFPHSTTPALQSPPRPRNVHHSPHTGPALTSRSWCGASVSACCCTGSAGRKAANTQGYPDCEAALCAPRSAPRRATATAQIWAAHQEGPTRRGA